MPKSAIFAGSFDPFTAGHENIVRRALTLFDHIVIAVGYNIKKQGLLTTENRVRLIRDTFAGDSRIEVLSYEGFTTDLCRRTGINTLLRGLRSVDDFEGDRTIDAINKRLHPDVETFYLLTDPYLGAISSAVVKEVLAHGGDPAPFMPQSVDLTEYL